MDNSPHTQVDRNPALLIRARGWGDKEADSDRLRPSAATMRVFLLSWLMSCQSRGLMSGHVLPTVSHVTSSVIRDGSKCLYDAGLNLSVGIHCRGRLGDALQAILSCCQQRLDGLGSEFVHDRGWTFLPRPARSTGSGSAGFNTRSFTAWICFAGFLLES
jgi:hypothetical protein